MKNDDIRQCEMLRDHILDAVQDFCDKNNIRPYIQAVTYIAMGKGAEEAFAALDKGARDAQNN